MQLRSNIVIERIKQILCASHMKIKGVLVDEAMMEKI